MPLPRLLGLSAAASLMISSFAYAANEGGNDGAMDAAAANNGMDIPVFTGVSLKNATTLSVAGYVGTQASKIAGAHRIEVYTVGANADPSGFGEVEAYIGFCDGTNGTNVNGTFECDLTLPSGMTLAVADKITATATYDPTASDGYERSTSEFSFNETIRSCLEVANTMDSGASSLRAP